MDRMDIWNNRTTGTDFVLLGLFHCILIPKLLFTFIFLVFLVALIVNIMMVILIWLNSQLHTPMYFLLSQLSLMDLLYISTFVPKIAIDFFVWTKQHFLY